MATHSARPTEKTTDPHRHARTFRQDQCLDAHGVTTLHVWRGEVWRWKEGRYRPINKEQFKCELNLSLKRSIDKRNIVGGDFKAVAVTGGLVNNVIAALAAEVMVPDDVEQPAWLGSDSTDIELLAATNGLLSLAGTAKGTLRPHTPHWFSSVCVPYGYDPTAECPRWKTFLNQVLECDVERIAILQEWFGYLLTPDTRFHKFMVMEGEGANGKSVVLEIVEAMVGHENVSHVPLEAFGQRFQLTMALNKLVNIAPEVNENIKLDEGMVKQFVAGDTIYCDRKGIGGLDVKPTARLMVATNNRPAIADRSLGMWRRMLHIPFNVTIPPADQDRELAAKLKGELPGILNWALEGRERLHQQGHFTVSSIATAAAAEYRAESNPTKEFLDGHCHIDQAKSVWVEQAYGRYRDWAKANGHAPLTSAQFGKEVKKHYPQAERRRITAGAFRPWVYRGLVVDDGLSSSSDSFEEVAA